MISSMTSACSVLIYYSSTECTRGLHIVKAFLDMATHNTVESLQALCVPCLLTQYDLTLAHSANTHIPSPPWAAVAPVNIPFSSINRAADTLIDWFGEDINVVVGGQRWWQVRGMSDGLDAEWITERAYLSNAKAPSGSKFTAAELDIHRMADLEAVMVCMCIYPIFWKLTAHSSTFTEVFLLQYVPQFSAHICYV
jgi:hypothetical protein